MTLGGGPIEKDLTLDWEDLIRYYRKTKYSQTHATDSIRRAKTIVKFAGLAQTTKTEYENTITSIFNGEAPISSPTASAAQASTSQPAAVTTASAGTKLLGKKAVFPLVINKDLALTENNVADYYKNTEKNMDGGHFPLGSNGQWHGGVHIPAKASQHVHCIAEGEVVAARLTPTDLADGNLGSHNFVLVKHTFKGKQLNNPDASKKLDAAKDYTFYSLYMHLGGLDLTQKSTLATFEWLAGDGKKITQAQTETHTVKEGETLNVLVEKWNTTIAEIRAKNPDLESHYGQTSNGVIAWYYPNDVVKRPDIVSVEKSLDDATRNALNSGEVVSFKNNKVVAGSPLWIAGQFGKPAKPMLHWEIFSAENLIPNQTESRRI